VHQTPAYVEPVTSDTKRNQSQIYSAKASVSNHKESTQTSVSAPQVAAGSVRVSIDLIVPRMTLQIAVRLRASRSAEQQATRHAPLVPVGYSALHPFVGERSRAPQRPQRAHNAAQPHQRRTGVRAPPNGRLDSRAYDARLPRGVSSGGQWNRRHSPVPFVM